MHAIKRIAILGMGGVGGFYGGKLAAHYAANTDVEIIFIARGENEKAIREKGLLLRTPSGEQIIHPKIVSHDPDAIGDVDLLICTIKAYDLEESIAAIAPCIGAETIVLPLLNGVDNLNRIHKLLPQATCWQGCSYIVSRLTNPGVVIETGIWNQLYFGSEVSTEQKIQQLENIFTEAGINAKGIKEITPVVWTKFLFLSPIATMTTSLNLPMGAVLENELHAATLCGLIAEIAGIAIAKKIPLPISIESDILEKMRKLPFATYSSMHFDQSYGKKTEVDSLTGYVVKLGKELGIPTPVHELSLSVLNAL
ncbi:MAG: 2-dehydropantoate 2-reductase [Chitinophagales bacterium]